MSIAAGVLLAALLSSGLVGAVFQRERIWLEDDLMCLLPLAAQKVAHAPARQVLDFIFHSGETSTPFWNLTVFLWLKAFGLNLKGYVATLLVLHHLNALLLFLLLRRGMGFSPAGAFLASVVSLTFHPQFHVYSWPVAVQHLWPVFLALAVLLLYVETEGRLRDGRRWRGWWIATLLAGAVSSFARISVLVAPFCILLDILREWNRPKGLMERYRRWLPLLIVAAAYPCVALAHGTSGSILKGFLPAFASSTLPPSAVSFLLFLAAALLLILPAFYLHRLAPRIPAALTGNAPVLMAAGAGLGLLAWHLPSLGWPFVRAFALFFVPWKSLQADGLFGRWHPITIHTLSPTLSSSLCVMGVTLLVLGPVGVFLWRAWRHCPRQLMLAGWYLFVAPYASRFPDAMPSRYFVYLTPVLAAALVSAFWEAPLAALKRVPPARSLYRGAAGILLVLFACLNLWSTRRAVYLTRFSDYFWSYDSIRVAELIREDLRARGRIPPVPSAIVVEGLPPNMPYYRRHFATWVAPEWDYRTHHPFRYILGVSLEAPLDELPSVGLEAPVPEPGGGFLRYKVEGFDLYDVEGLNIDPFFRHYREGVEHFNAGRHTEALKALDAATLRRPFLVRFMTSGRSLAHFGKRAAAHVPEVLRQCRAAQDPRDEKLRYITRLVRQETLSYARALLLRSYLEDRAGALMRADADVGLLPWLLHPREMAGEDLLDFVRDPAERSRLRRFLDDCFPSYLDRTPPG